MTLKEIEQHTKILGWLHIIGHAFFLLAGICAFLVLTSVGGLAIVGGEPEAMGVFGIVAVFTAGLMLLLALPGLLAGYGLLKRRSWGRILAIIVGILNLPNFPLGTVGGIYTLYVLLQSEANAYFGGKELAI